MPIVAIPVRELNSRLGKEIERDELLEILAQNGSDIEDVVFLQRYRCSACGFILERTESEGRPSSCDNCFLSFSESPEKLMDLDPVEVIRMELLAVRPDLFEVAGLARMLKGYLGLEKGLKSYPYRDSDYLVEIDPSLSRPDSFRPEVACAVIKNIRFNDFFIKSIMKLQENLHWAMGRNRKLASIGVHDLEAIEFPVKYTAVDKHSFRFNPLPFSEWDKKPMSCSEILAVHPKGRAFAHLLDGFARYPLQVDAKGQVLSMPPIINAMETMVKMETRDIFIDVTGPYRDKVEKTLNTFVCALLENQDGLELYRVSMKSSDIRKTPRMETDEMEISPEECNRLIGFSINAGDMENLLEKARYDAELINEHKIRVKIPPYRSDIMHPHDIFEDIAIMYGYHNLIPHRITSVTEGREHIVETYSNSVREIFTGLSFIELNTLFLTNRNTLFYNMNIEPDENTVIIENPASNEQEVVRSSLLPGLLEALSFNKHNPLPQKIYEIGDISIICDDTETKSRDIRKLAGAIIDSKTGFSDIRAVLQVLFRSLSRTLEIKPAGYPFYLEGRSGDIYFDSQGESIRIGHVGEIHPEVISRFKLLNPVVAFEISLMDWIEKENF